MGRTEGALVPTTTGVKLRVSGCLAAAVLAITSASGQHASNVLPPRGTAKLSSSLEAAAEHRRHVWRDTPPVNDDGTINAYVEIPAGERRKWELDMRRNARAVNRVIPADVGGYPVNYGFVPQTVWYDGDPFDALVIGPPLAGGEFVRGVVVALMHMEDEKGSDSKVVLTPSQGDGGAPVELTPADRQRIADFFRRYKKDEPDGFSRVSGWGTAEEGLAHVRTARAFFLQCRKHAGRACSVTP
jgi:inorganic pyrophosphatase